jgi:hypothetical protein
MTTAMSRGKEYYQKNREELLVKRKKRTLNQTSISMEKK